MSVNPHRGEVEITLDGKAYPMLPSYGAMGAIESQLGSVVVLARRLADPQTGAFVGNLTVREMAVIACESIRAAGKDRGDNLLQAVSVDRIGELIYAVGVLEAMLPISILLGNMLSGGARKKSEEAATTPST